MKYEMHSSSVGTDGHNMEVEQNLSWLRQNTFCLGYLRYFGAANRRVSCETLVTDLQVLFHTAQTHFHMKGLHEDSF